MVSTGQGPVMRFLPSKVAIYAALSAILVAGLSWLRRDARRDLRRDAEIEDFENAEDIIGRVSRDRADPERVRRYEGSGWRD